MKAIVYTEYGPPEVVRLQEVEKPIPKGNEVLIKVHATTVTTGDVNVRGFTFVPRGLKFVARLMLGLNGPKKKILGCEFAGEIVAIGNDVRLFNVGDQVFGIDGTRMGAHAEYKCIPEKAAVVLKPANITYEEAAAIPNGALTALYFLRELGKIQSGHKVLVNGASGSVGSAAVMLAKDFGAHVSGVCSTPNIGLVKSLGADKVFDYTKENFLDNDDSYDLILDTVGNISFDRSKKSLSERGKLLLVAGGLPEFSQALWTSIASKKKVLAGGGFACEKKEYLELIKKLLESAKFRPIIDKRFSLEQAREAHAYVDTGRKKGSVVIFVQQESRL